MDMIEVVTIGEGHNKYVSLSFLSHFHEVKCNVYILNQSEVYGVQNNRYKLIQNS